VHNVSQWPNLRHLGEPLRGGGGAEGLLEAVSFKKATESRHMGMRKRNAAFQSEFQAYFA